jgi:hypothetical protein
MVRIGQTPETLATEPTQLAFKEAASTVAYVTNRNNE